MPKTSHGPAPKLAPPSLVILLKRVRNTGDPLVQFAQFEGCIERAEVLEERLIDLHDAVEKAIGLLNEEASNHELGRNVESALAELNKVL